MWRRASSLLLALLLSSALTVGAQTMDVSPGDGANEINVKGKGQGQTAVAILCSPAFAPVGLVDKTTLYLGPSQAPALKCAAEDVNQDGCIDLKCGFRTRLLGVTCDQTAITLTGALQDTTTFTIADKITPVPCQDKADKPDKPDKEKPGKDKPGKDKPGKDKPGKDGAEDEEEEE